MVKSSKQGSIAALMWAEVHKGRCSSLSYRDLRYLDSSDTWGGVGRGWDLTKVWPLCDPAVSWTVSDTLDHSLMQVSDTGSWTYKPRICLLWYCFPTLLPPQTQIWRTVLRQSSVVDVETYRQSGRDLDFCGINRFRSRQRQEAITKVMKGELTELSLAPHNILEFALFCFSFLVIKSEIEPIRVVWGY